MASIRLGICKLARRSISASINRCRVSSPKKGKYSWYFCRVSLKAVSNSVVAETASWQCCTSRGVRWSNSDAAAAPSGTPFLLVKSVSELKLLLATY